ncbi:MAG TPA: membrane protein insertase YidC [Fimbriimonadaceae bacterium]|nr:membrane protein insertase YidC [Fimbriimonadaceae bacterium]
MSKNPPKKPAGKPGAGGPPPKGPNWGLLIALWIGMFLILRLFNQQQPGPQLTIDAHLANIHANAAKLLDGTAAKEFNESLVSQINTQISSTKDLIKKGRLSAADGNAQIAELNSKLLDGAVTVSDGLLRGSRSIVANGQLIPLNEVNGQLVPYRNFSYDKTQQAYQLLENYSRQFGDSELWNREYTVEGFNGSKQTYSPASLFLEARNQLSALNEHSPVWGFIPGYQLIDFLVHVTGGSQGFSYSFAAFLLALAVRGVIWPLSQRQLMWGRQMSQLAPMLREIKEKHKDPTIQQKKTMELYREYGLNPFAGCWPALVQLPLFLVVYQCMLHYRFEFQKGTFLWINEATGRATHGFTAANLGQKDTILIIIYAVTLLISTLLTPVNDPTQVRQQRTIGISVALLFPVFMLTGTYPVPAAFVLYWTFTNVLATAQSLRAYYMLPAPPLVKVNTPTGGVHPTTRRAGWWDKFQESMQKQMEERQRLVEEQARQIKGANDDEEPPSGAGPTNGKPASDPKPPTGGKQKPPSGGKQKPKRRPS